MVVREQLLGFARGEAEVDGPDLGQVTGGAEPAQSQSGVRAGDDDQVRLSRQVRDQELDLLVAGRLLDEVEVVEDEDEVVRSGCQSAHDGREQGPRATVAAFAPTTLAGSLTGRTQPARSRAAATWVHNRSGSLSPLSRETQAAACPGRPFSHCATSGGLAVARRGQPRE